MNDKMAKPAIFLDRDGTLNKNCPYCKSKEEIILYDDIFEPLKELSKHFYIIIITNQSGIARGYFTEQALYEMNNKIKEEVERHGGRIDAFYYCPHMPDSGCKCRKPEPGLVYKAMEDFDIDLKHSFVVGDDEKDMELAKKLGIIGIMVRNSQGSADYFANDFKDVLRIINSIRAKVKR